MEEILNKLLDVIGKFTQNFAHRGMLCSRQKMAVNNFDPLTGILVKENSGNIAFIAVFQSVASSDWMVKFYDLTKPNALESPYSVHDGRSILQIAFVLGDRITAKMLREQGEANVK